MCVYAGDVDYCNVDRKLHTQIMIVTVVCACVCPCMVVILSCLCGEVTLHRQIILMI